MSLPSTLVLRDPLLFNDPRYHALHAPPGARGVVLAHDDVGALAGVLDGDRLTSGYSAPFGGVDLVRRDDETPGRIVALVRDVVAQADALGVRELTVRCAPRCHAHVEDAVRFALLSAGFAVAEADLTFTLDLGATPDAEAWLAARKKPLRRAVAAAAPLRLALSDEEDPAAWDAPFATLVANRAARGRRLSIDLPRVLAVRDAFGDRIRLAGLRTADGALVAAALTYRVTPVTETVVAWGDAPDHGLAVSPMPTLAHRLVERALRDGLRALDLGTSTVVGPDGARVPNDGLVQFKRSLGADAELRPVLRRGIAR